MYTMEVYFCIKTRRERMTQITAFVFEKLYSSVYSYKQIWRQCRIDVSVGLLPSILESMQHSNKNGEHDFFLDRHKSVC